MSDLNRRFVDVPLTETEIDICNYIGNMRYKITSEMASDMRQTENLNSIQMVIDGVVSEYAVSKLLNLNFDFNCDFRKFGADFVSSKGSLIDVKCTRRSGGHLNAVRWSVDKPVDIFILTEILTSHVRVVGWIRREDFLKEENLIDVGNGLFYGVDQSQLTPFDENKLKAKYEQTKRI